VNESYHIVIPARMASQRLPGKPLLDVSGETLLRRVYDCASRSGAARIVIATDDEQIFAVARDFGAEAVMTSAEHQSGSDRIAECARLLGWADEELVVNLQGDEPQMPPVCLDQVASLLMEDTDAEVASLFYRVQNREEAANPNAVKVVLDKRGRALYFSRSMIPYPRAADGSVDDAPESAPWRRHIGLYAYRVAALKLFTSLPPSPLESTEKLEQLRFLEAGCRIRMAQACEPIPPGVDTPDDLARVRAFFHG
jgi:3-deoxy-manno-octulosonate cytidylyltransferase (CMP-KDO synthetase)